MRITTGNLTDWPAQLRRLRRLVGLKQAALAEMIGVDQATVSRWECGRMVPDVAMQRRLVAVMRSASIDEFVLRHAVESALGQVVLSNADHIIQAASASYCAAHGVTQAEIVGMSGRPMYAEDSERFRRFAHDHGFYRGDIASLDMAARAHSLRGGRRNMRVRVLWTPVCLVDGTILLRSERLELSAREYEQFRNAEAGPLRVVAMDDLLATSSA